MPITETINERLDQVEHQLPAVPKAVFRFNRAATERVVGGTERAIDVVTETFGNVGEFASDNAKNVVGTANKYSEEFGDVAEARVKTLVTTAQKFATDAQRLAEESFDVASEGFKKVAGQFGIVLGEAETTVAEKVTTGARKVEASEAKAEKAHLAKMTKAELYEMAKDLDIEGRATMSKSELVKAIANH